MRSQSIQASGQRTIQLETQSLAGLQAHINADFVRAVESLAAMKGRLVVTGIGKSAIIGQKIVATLNSTGTPALFMHAADAIHGDLGMIQPEDLILVISKSGESEEIKVLLPLLRHFGNPLIAMVGNVHSALAQQASILLNTTVSQEACPNNLAPTSSTTAQLAMGDALAVALMDLRGFNPEDFAKFHPGGALGKRLFLTVQDLSGRNERPQVLPESPLKEVILEITKKRLGATAVTGPGDALIGVITDGDLRRMLEKNPELQKICARDIMSTQPKTIEPSALAAEALDRMRRYDISQLVVAENGRYRGFIHLHDLIREGIL